MEVYLATINYTKDQWEFDEMLLHDKLEVEKDESHYLIENYPKYGVHTHLSWVLKLNQDIYDEIYIVGEKIQNIKLESHKIDGEQFYYQKAKGIKSEDVWTYDSKHANVGFSVPGTVIIKGKKSDIDYPLGTITFKPSLLTVRELQGMLVDLFHIHAETITNSERQEQISTGDLYDVQSLLQHLRKIVPALKQINQNPLVDLIRTVQYQSVHQTRSFDISFELNKEMNPGLQKYKGARYIQEINTLENQMIKQILKNLRDHAYLLQANHQDNKEKSNTIVKIIKVVEYLLTLPLFKRVYVRSNIRLKPTQLFINDQRYRTIWHSLKYIEKETRFSIYAQQLTKQLASTFTYQIYETWLYFKMVNILVEEMGWQVVDKDMAGKAIDTFYSKLKKNTYLGHPVNYSMKLVNGDFNVALLYEFENGYRPDFMFVFTYKGIKLGRAILDAKYQPFNQLIAKRKNALSEIEGIYEKYTEKMKFPDAEKIYSTGVVYPGFPEENQKNKNPYDLSKYLDCDGASLEEVNVSGLSMRPEITHEFKNWFMLTMELGVKSSTFCSGCGDPRLVKKNRYKQENLESQIYCQACSYNEKREFDLFIK